MADVLTREETAEILENVYKDNFEGTELAKKITNIPKLLDKFEGKYDKMVAALKKKYPDTKSSDNPLADYASVEKGLPEKDDKEPQEETEEETEEEPEEGPEEETEEGPEEETEEESEEETEEETEEGPEEEPEEGPEEETEEETEEGPEEETEEGPEEETDEDSLNWEAEDSDDKNQIEDSNVNIELTEGELTRVRVSVLIEEAYRQNLDDPDKKIAGIEKLLDKFEGRYEKLLEAVYKKYPIQKTTENLVDTANSFDDLLEAIGKENSNYSKWLELADYYDNLGMIGRSKECRDYANSLQS